MSPVSLDFSGLWEDTVEMDVSRLRELTHCRLSLRCIRAFRCRNGCFPFKGIDTILLQEQPLLSFRRNGCFPFKGIDTIVLLQFWNCLQGRNGCFPFKGIDTQHFLIIFPFSVCCRNGCFPFKGIDTTTNEVSTRRLCP